MAVVADAFLVVVWLIASAIVRYFSSTLTIPEHDKWVFDAVSVFLATTTFGAVFILTLKDLAIIAIRAINDIRAEISSGKAQADLDQPDLGSSVDRLKNSKHSEQHLNIADSEVSTSQEESSSHASTG